ncbi:MAG: T9SS type A sorting domain-containing protein [Chitinophagaceae bacterium]|nr:T9SS type A sorting domain-containing protein [Chitinophagaceae bacterium]
MNNNRALEFRLSYVSNKSVLIKSTGLICFIIIFFNCCLRAQSPSSIEWQKCLGGSWYEIAKSVQQTSDGGFIVAGYTESTDGDISGNHGGSDYWVVKLDSYGVMEWQKCLGGSYYEFAHSVQQTTDKGFIVAGYSSSNDGDVSGNHGDYDYWIVKLDSTGTMEWQKCLGGSKYDAAHSIQQTSDGGFIVAGETGSTIGDVSGNHGSGDYWVVKLDGSGNIEWQKCLGGSDYDVAQSVQQTSDGGFIVAGYTSSNDGNVSGNNSAYSDYYDGYYSDYWIVKLDSAGNIEWQKCLGGSYDEYAFSIQQTMEGGYIVAGSTGSNDGEVSGNNSGYTYYDFYYMYSDYWVVKLNDSGDIEWQKCLGGSYDDYAFSIQQTMEGGYIVAGTAYTGNAFTNPPNDGDISGGKGDDDYWIVKLSGTGNIQWKQCLGGGLYEYAYSIQQTADGGLIIAGETASEDGDVSGNDGPTHYWIVKLYTCNDSVLFYADADGDGYGNAGVSQVTIACSYPEGYTMDSTDCNDTDPYTFPGSIEIPENYMDDDCDGVIDEVFGVGISSIADDVPVFFVFPNPTGGLFKLTLQLNEEDNADAKIEVIGLLGQIVYTEKAAVEKGKLQKEIQLSPSTARGMYLVKVTTGDEVHTTKIHLTK